MGKDFDEFEAMFGNMNDSEVQIASDSPTQRVVEENTPRQMSQDLQMNNTMSQAPTVQKKQSLSKGVSDDFEIGFSKDMEDSLSEMGIEVGDIGVKISKVPIERYKASVSKVDRISFLTKRVIPVKYHFIDGIGSVMCFHGKCCEIGGVPQIRYLFPIAVYQTDADGNLSGSKVELKILSAGEDLYKSIITINRGTAQYGGIDHGDMLVTCTDEKYQKISLTFAGAAIWRQYRDIAEFLQKRWIQDGANAYMAVARKLDETTFNKLLHLDEDDGVSTSYDSAANTDLSKFFED
jgi:hypothetical protein